MDIIYEIDFAILDALQKIHSGVLNVIMAFFSFIANGGAVWIAAAALLLLFKKYRTAGVAVSLSLIIELVLNEKIIKPLVARPRPFTLNPEIDTIISQPSSYSFPSGHTCSSFAAATAIFMFNKRLGAVAYAATFLIGFSRNYFYIHYPSDVLCGAILGTLIGLAVSIALKKAVTRFQPSPPQDQ